MQSTLILVVLVGLNLFCIAKMWFASVRQPSPALSRALRFKLAVSGILAYFADTLGVGSFAVNIACAKGFKTFQDEQLPAVNNGAQVIPGLLESLIFMQVFPVDFITLFTLVSGACLGGVLGAHVLSRLNKQAIRIAMISCFIGMIALIGTDLLGFMPGDCTLTVLRGNTLLIGFVGMLVCGALTTVGIGLFAMVQAVLFILGVSPAVAFPIMTTAGAMQQPLTTLVFLKQNRIPLKKTLFLSAMGCIGIFLALPIISHLNKDMLHGLLLVIISFNLYTVSKAYFNARPQTPDLTAANDPVMVP